MSTAEYTIKSEDSMNKKGNLLPIEVNIKMHKNMAQV